jgi:SnoaL-like protein
VNAFPTLMGLGLSCISYPFGAVGDQPTDEGAARRAIEAHYATAPDPKTVPQSSELYTDDAVLEFPQGGERIRGKANIIAFRTAYPAKVDFDLRRTVGTRGLWVNEGVIRYDGEKPTHFVGIMEFRGDKVFRETIYFGEPWTPPAWRSQWVELIQSECR